MKTVEELYQQLEHKSDLGFVNLNYNDFGPDVQNAVAKEDWCFWPIENINPTELIDFDENVEYFKQRIDNTTNIYLKTRYAHILYLLTRGGVWFQEATVGYKHIISNAITSNLEAGEIHSVLCDYVSLILSEGKKHHIELFYYLLDIIKSSQSATLQNWVIHLFKNKELYVKEEIEYLVNKCLSIYENINDSGEKKFALDNGLYFAKKDPVRFKEQLSQIYEMLGDYESTMLRIDDGLTDKSEHAFYNDAHLTKMLDYYKKAGERAVEKYNATLCRHNENKKHIRFETILEEFKLPKEGSDMIINHFKKISKYDTIEYIEYMIHGDSIVFWPISKNNAEYYNSFGKSGISLVKYDINTNSIPVTKEMLGNEGNLFVYDLIVVNLLPRMIAEILDAIKSKKLTSKKLVKYLREARKRREDCRSRFGRLTRLSQILMVA